MDNNRPFVSVIIPTYHDWGRLMLCIDALKMQTYPHDHFEVIIVNNDPNDAPPGLDLPDNFFLTYEGKPGSYSARNKGIRLSKGEILAFTDSDCVPYPDWIERAVEVLLEGSERIAGRVELFFKNPRKLTVAEIYEKAFAFNQVTNADNGASVTANMITWRKHFDEVGLFDDSLMSGGDMEWGWRANDMGIDIVYSPDVVVRHPARHTLKDLLGKRSRVIEGGLRIQRKKAREGRFMWFIRGFLPPVRGYIVLAKMKDLTFREKIITGLLMYYLKLFNTFCKTKLLTESLKK